MRSGINEIASSCVNGVKNAWKSYYESTGGSWLWAAPEYFITVNIFNELSRLNLLVELESNVRNCVHNASIQYPGRYPSSLNLNGRFDVVVYWKSGLLRGILEIKMMRGNSLSGIKSDLQEISSFLKLASNKNSRMQFGGIVVYTDFYEENGKAERVIERRLNNVFTLGREVLKGYKIIKQRKIKNIIEEKSAWGTIVCIFKT